MWYVYMLLCDKKTYYVGTTNNLPERMREHKEGRSFFTKQFSACELVYQEWHPDQKSATKREKQLKALSRGEKQKLASGL